MIKKAWQLIYNNKRNIGIGILLINQGLRLFAPSLMSIEQYSYIDTVGLTIGGSGVVHHGYNKINKNNKNK